MPQDGLKNKFYPLHFPPSNIKTLGSGFFFAMGYATYCGCHLGVKRSLYIQYMFLKINFKKHIVETS